MHLNMSTLMILLEKTDVCVMCRYKGRDGDENEPAGGWN